MIRVYCSKCGVELEDSGALIISPPIEKNLVHKYHICRKCWDEMKEAFK